MKHLKKFNEGFSEKDTFSLQELKDAITMAYNKDRTMEFDDDKQLLLDFIGSNEDSISLDIDWNFLMQVIDKIDSLDYNCNVEITSTYVNIDTLPRIIHRKGNRFENTYKACIDFVNWYNEKSH